MAILLRAHGAIMKIDHTMTHKTSLNAFIKVEVIQNVLTDNWN